jgi:hypothetical protein
MAGFYLQQQDQRILGRLTASGGLGMKEFKTQYRQMLEAASNSKQKRKVLFDLSHASSWSLYVELKDELQTFFACEIKTLSEKVVSKCIVVIPDSKLATAISTIIRIVGSQVSTEILSEMPGKTG